jgi:small-conductance mechanosensitive channel
MLGFKDIIPNVFASYFILKKNNLTKGDFISVGNFEGVIEKVNLVDTILKIDEKEVVYVPNTYFIKNSFTKKTISKKNKK